MDNNQMMKELQSHKTDLLELQGLMMTALPKEIMDAEESLTDITHKIIASIKEKDDLLDWAVTLLANADPSPLTPSGIEWEEGRKDFTDRVHDNA